MSMMQWGLLLAVPAVAFLAWYLRRAHASGSIQQFNNGRRGSSKLVGRGEFIDGSRHIPVALALSDSAFYYENSDMHAFLELKWIHEVRYENELTTGRVVENGKVLLLRCFSQAFEFVLDGEAVKDWKAALPAHLSEPALGGAR